MKRRWGTRLFLDRCRLVREALPNPAFTTDIIVGFPGETEEDFASTLRVSREAGFSKIHIFPFSARKGTPAADYADTVHGAVKAERCEQLAALEKELRAEYFHSLLGQRLRVLVEGPAKEANAQLAGTACRYAPVVLPANHPAAAGELVEITPLRVQEEVLLA
jgi:threonylcarbamoyladenosine tRNA methylthiotransferase MtaB